MKLHTCLVWQLKDNYNSAFRQQLNFPELQLNFSDFSSYIVLIICTIIVVNVFLLLLFIFVCPIISTNGHLGEMRWTEFQSWEPLEFREEQVLTMKIFIFCICPNLIKLLLVKCKPLSSKLKMDNFKTGGHSFATALLLVFIYAAVFPLVSSNRFIFKYLHILNKTLRFMATRLYKRT